MKYEMIFGDPQLFNDAPDDAVLVSVQLGDFRYFTEENLQVCKKFNIYKLQSCDTQLAMRRIIPEPKRWTVEDQSAGRLPDVGCSVLFTHNNFKCEVIAIDDSVTEDVELALRFSDGSILVCKINKIKPIETSEEKAARLRSEWINKAYVDFHRIGCELEVLQKEQIKQIYDALLSGELTMPGKVDE